MWNRQLKKKNLLAVQLQEILHDFTNPYLRLQNSDHFLLSLRNFRRFEKKKLTNQELCGKKEKKKVELLTDHLPEMFTFSCKCKIVKKKIIVLNLDSKVYDLKENKYIKQHK